MIGESLGERGRRGDDSGTEDSGKWADLLHRSKIKC